MQEYFFSPTDIWSALKKTKKLLLIVSLLFAGGTLLWKLSTPITYHAEGVLKGGVEETRNAAYKALAAISGGEMGSPTNDSAATLIDSHQVLKRVVQRLVLQGQLLEKKRRPFSFIQTLFRNIQTEWAYSPWGSSQPHSSVLDKACAIPDRILFQSDREPLQFSHIHYDAEIHLPFEIIFHDEHLFSCTDRSGKLLASGELGVPIYLENGSFVLAKNDSSSLSGKRFSASLVPLDSVVDSLRRGLKIVHDKKRPSLIHISYRNTDSELAAKIVSEVMNSYFLYLKEDGEEKIGEQTLYLEKKKREKLASLDHAIKDYEENMASHGLIDLKQEVRVLSEQQTLVQANLATYEREALSLYKTLFSEKATFGQLREKHIACTPLFSLDATKKMLHDTTIELDKSEMEERNLDFALEKLETLDVISLSKTITDPAIVPLFQEIENLHLKLLDIENWSQKERAVIQSTLDIRKSHLKMRLKEQKESIHVNQALLREKQALLKLSLLKLLVEAYEKEETHILALEKRAQFLRKIVLSDEKMALNKDLESEMLATLSKLIETRNIAFKMQSLESRILKPASVPPLPLAPHLLLTSFLSAFLGGFCFLLALVFREVRRGPSCSYPNLKALGFKVEMVSEKLVDEILFEIESKKRIIFLSHRREPLFQKLMNYAPEKTWISFDCAFDHPTIRAELQHADFVCAVLHNERIQDIKSLPGSTFYIVGSDTSNDAWVENFDSLSLSKIEPLLKQFLSRFSFSSSK